MIGLANSVLLTGASGYLGTMAVAGLLAQDSCRIIAPVRQGHTRESMIERIKTELADDCSLGDIDFERLSIVALPPVDDIGSLAAAMRDFDVEEIIHCAGSVDYFDLSNLKESNIDLTSGLLSLGKQLHVGRFVYLSTAFSSGYVVGPIRETLHKTPDSDPTEYTRSKRQAETLVADSSLPYLIIRPSIVIGDGRDGRYSGKPYGLYQLWAACEKLLCDRYRSELHFIAPQIKLQVIHQEAFQAAFLAARHQLPKDSIVHLVSRPDTLPTVREVTQLWNETCAKPRQVYYYDDFDQVPTEGLDRRIRTFLEFASVNLDIATHAWQFETTS